MTPDQLKQIKDKYCPAPKPPEPAPLNEPPEVTIERLLKLVEDQQAEISNLKDALRIKEYLPKPRPPFQPIRDFPPPYSPKEDKPWISPPSENPSYWPEKPPIWRPPDIMCNSN